MRYLLASVSLLALASAASAADVPVVSKIDGVTVFPQGAEVVRVAKVRLEKGEHALIVTDLPAQAVAGSIRVEGKATGKLEIGSVDTRRVAVARADAANAQSERKRIEDEIEALTDQKKQVEGHIAALEAQKSLLTGLTQLPTRPAPAPGTQPGGREEWRDILALIGSGMLDAHRAVHDQNLKVREIDRRIKDLQKALANVPPLKEERTEVKVFAAAAAPLEADLTISYQVTNASWTPFYDARLATGAKNVSPKLQLVRRASITQRAGEPWDDVTIKLSTTRPSAGAAAPQLHTITVDFEPEIKPEVASAPPAPPRPAMARRAEGGMKKEMAQDALAAAPVPESIALEERKAKVDIAPFQAVFNVPSRVSVANTGEAKRVQLGEDSLEPALAVRTVPKLDTKAYLYAKLVVPKGSPLMPGKVSLFRDTSFVGTGNLPLLSAGEEHELGFGVDDAVRVRHMIADEKRGETGLISSSRTDSRNYRLSVKNLHERAIPLVVLDQIPVSQNQEIKVELTGRTAPTKRDVDDKRGVLSWETNLAPDEERTIEFGYKVTWPAAKQIQYGN